MRVSRRDRTMPRRGIAAGVAVAASLVGYLLTTIDPPARAAVSPSSVCPVVGLGGPTVGTPGGGQAIDTTLNYPVGIATNPATGQIYISERGWDLNTYSGTLGQGRIRRIDPDGSITDIALSPGGRRLGRLALSLDGQTLYAGTGDFNSDTTPRVFAIDLTSPAPTPTLVAGGGATAPSTTGTTATSTQLGVVTDLEVSPLTGRLYIGIRAANPSVPTQVLELDGTTLRRVVGGGGDANGDGVNTLTASLGTDLSLSFDSAGNLNLGSFRRIRKVTPAATSNPYGDGTIATFAGANGTEAASGDGGTAAAARFGDINSVVTDPGGNIFVGAERVHTVRRINAAGTLVTTVAGGDPSPTSDAGVMGFAEGSGTSVRFAYTREMALLGDDLLVVDSWNNRVRRLENAVNVALPTVTTIAGRGPNAIGSESGPALTHPTGVVWGIDRGPDGSLYLPDLGAHRVWRRAPDGTMSVVAGNGRFRDLVAPVATGPATSTALGVIRDVGVSPDGSTLYILERTRVLQVDLGTGVLSVLAGTGAIGQTDGPAATATLDSRTGGRMAVGDGVIWITGIPGTVRRITLASGQIDTPVTGISPDTIVSGIAIDPNGDLLLTDPSNGVNRIVFVEVATGTATTVLGGTGSALTPDGLTAAASQTTEPSSPALRGDRLYFAHDGTIIRYITAGSGTGPARWSSGIVSTLAGSTRNDPLDGPGNWGDGLDISTDPTAVRLNGVRDATVDPDGRLFLVDDSGLANPNSVTAIANGPQTIRVVTDRGCAEATLTGPATSPSAVANSVGLTDLPVSQIPFDLSAVASTPLRAVPLRAVGERSTPLRAVPLRAVPLRAVSLAGTPLRAVTLSSLVLDPVTYPGGWPQRLDGTPYEGIPPQNIRLEQLLDDPATPSIDETSVALTASPEITLAAIDLSTSPLRAVSIASLALGATPLRAVPLNEALAQPGVTDAERFQAWCDLLSDGTVPEISGLGLDCSEIGPDAPLLALEVRSVPLRAVPLRAVPLRAVDLAASPLRAVPLRAVGLEPSPLRAVPLRAVPLRAVAEASAPLRAVPLRAVPLRAVELNASPLRAVQLSLLGPAASTVATCFPGCSTLGEATDLGAVSPTATIGDLIPALSAPLAPGGAAPTLGDLRFFPEGTPEGFFGAPGAETEVNLGDINQGLPEEPFISLADLLLGLVPAPDLPWEDVDLSAAGVDTVAGASAPAALSFSFRLYPTLTGTVPMSIELPPDWRYRATDSAQVSPDAGASAPIVPTPTPTTTLNPTTGIQTVSYELPSGLAAPSTVQLTVSATTGMRLGTFQAQASVGPVLPSAATSTVTSNAVTVVDPNEAGGTTFDTAVNIQPDRLYFGYLNTVGDTDYYAVAADGAGTLTTISLSQLRADADLVVYELDPAGIDLRSNVARLRQQAKPLQMVNPQIDVAGEPLEPQLLNDIAVLPDKKLAATSARAGLATETVELVNTKDSTSPGGTDLTYVIAVTAYGGATSPDPYMLRVRQTVPPGAIACSATGPDGIALPPVPSGFVPSDPLTEIPAGTQSLILVNRERLARAYGNAAMNSLISTLSNFSQRSDVKGLVVPVDADPEVRSAYAAWDASPCGLGRPNLVVREINNLVDALLAESTPASRASVQNLLVIGADEQIPMARLLDNTKISNELEYGAELRRAGGGSTPQTVAKSAKTVTSDDPYAALQPLLFGPDVIYPPTWTIGRLVETPDEIAAQVDAFVAADGRLAPDTAIVTGYDFLTDGSEAVADGLRDVTAVDDSLINDTWTAAQLDAKLTQPTDAPDISSINAHFDHYQLLPAAGETNPNEPLYTTADVATRPDQLTGRILFSMGCHSGTNASDFYMGATGGSALDWPQVFAQQRAIWVANTGFGYGDTAAVAYSEKLMARFAAGLRNGERAGEALRQAKQRYLGEGLSNSYDAKVLSQTVYYGLPMFRVGPGTPPPETPPYVTPTPDPSAGGLASVTRTVTPDLRLSAVQADGSRYVYGYDATEPVEALREKVQIADGRPIQPRVDLEVTAVGLDARGSVITAMDMTEAPLDVSIVQPTVDSSRNAPGTISTDLVYPSAFSNVTNTTGPVPRSRLVLVPGQFIADGDPASPPNRGVQRRFTSITATVYYGAPSDPDDIAPTITATSGIASSGVTFVARVADVDHDGDPGVVRRVVALYLDDTTWRSTDLIESAPGSGTYVGSGPASSSEVDFLIQAVDGSGNVGASSNKARLYTSRVAQSGGPANNAPVVIPGASPTVGAYDPVPITATFTDPDSTSWSATASSATTVQASITDGAVSATLPAFGNPGTYQVTVSVCDDLGECGTATVTVTVTGGGVSPVARCTVLSFAGAITWWDSVNTGSPASLPVGTLNRFDPPPQSRGQPTLIPAGTSQTVLTTQASAVQPLRWHLGSSTAAAMSGRGCSS